MYPSVREASFACKLTNVWKVTNTNDYSIAEESLVQATTNDFGRTVSRHDINQANDTIAPIFPAPGKSKYTWPLTSRNATDYG